VTSTIFGVPAGIDVVLCSEGAGRDEEEEEAEEEEEEKRRGSR
jgi:hypothetical protein